LAPDAPSTASVGDGLGFICRIDFRLMYGITLGAGGEPRAVAAAEEALGISRAIELGADLVGSAVVAAELRALAHVLGAD
jgi:hypothetical protein